jgi:hypothetical protein
MCVVQFASRRSHFSGARRALRNFGDVACRCSEPLVPSKIALFRESPMRITQVGISLILVLVCVCPRAATQEQKLTVRGKLVRTMSIGGESTGWTIQLDSEITIDSKPANSVEVDYPRTRKLEKLENKHVKATGKLSHRRGVETGDRTVLEVSSLMEAKGS